MKFPSDLKKSCGESAAELDSKSKIEAAIGAAELELNECEQKKKSLRGKAAELAAATALGEATEAPGDGR